MIEAYFDGLCEELYPGGPRNPGGVATHGYIVYKDGNVIKKGCRAIGHGKDITNNVARTKWSKEKILAEIKKTPNSRIAPYAIVNAAKRYFGSWCNAKKLAGLKPLHSGPSRAINPPLTKEAGYIIGSLMGDGWACVSKITKGTYRVGFSVKDKEFVDKFLDCWKQWIIYRPLVYQRKDNNMWVVQINSKELCFLIKEYKNNAISCLELSNEVQKGIVLGLIDAEAHVRFRTKNSVSVRIVNYNQRILDFLDSFMTKNNIYHRREKHAVCICTKGIIALINCVGQPSIPRKKIPIWRFDK